MKIGIFQDVHANLPAFQKAIEFFRKHQCSKIYHVGDLIGIGPHPKEVFDLATSIDDLVFIMGNHDYWFAFGLPDQESYGMSDEEVEHQKWVHQQIGLENRPKAQTWKFVESLDIDEKKITFLHYGYDEEVNWFKSFVKEPSVELMNQLFSGIKSDFIFYGHHHEASDLLGNCRFVNLGSAGCYHKAEVRLGILEIKNGQLKLEKHCVPYEDNGLMEDYEIRKVPARAFITSTFLTRS